MALTASQLKWLGKSQGKNGVIAKADTEEALRDRKEKMIREMNAQLDKVREEIRQGQTYVLEKKGLAGLLGGKINSIEDVAHTTREVDTWEDMAQTKALPPEQVQRILAAQTKVLELQKAMAEATEGGEPLFDEQELMEEVWDPLKRERIMPDNAIPAQYSRVQRAFEGSAKVMVDRLTEIASQTTSERDQWLAFVKEGTNVVGDAAVLVESLVPIGNVTLAKTITIATQTILTAGIDVSRSYLQKNSDMMVDGIAGILGSSLSFINPAVGKMAAGGFRAAAKSIPIAMHLSKGEYGAAAASLGDALQSALMLCDAANKDRPYGELSKSVVDEFVSGIAAALKSQAKTIDLAVEAMKNGEKPSLKAVIQVVITGARTAVSTYLGVESELKLDEVKKEKEEAEEEADKVKEEAEKVGEEADKAKEAADKAKEAADKVKEEADKAPDNEELAKEAKEKAEKAEDLAKEAENKAKEAEELLKEAEKKAKEVEEKEEKVKEEELKIKEEERRLDIIKDKLEPEKELKEEKEEAAEKAEKEKARREAKKLREKAGKLKVEADQLKLEASKDPTNKEKAKKAEAKAKEAEETAALAVEVKKHLEEVEEKEKKEAEEKAKKKAEKLKEEAEKLKEEAKKLREEADKDPTDQDKAKKAKEKEAEAKKKATLVALQAPLDEESVKKGEEKLRKQEVEEIAQKSAEFQALLEDTLSLSADELGEQGAEDEQKLHSIERLIQQVEADRMILESFQLLATSIDIAGLIVPHAAAAAAAKDMVFSVIAAAERFGQLMMFKTMLKESRNAMSPYAQALANNIDNLSAQVKKHSFDAVLQLVQAVGAGVSCSGVDFMAGHAVAKGAQVVQKGGEIIYKIKQKVEMEMAWKLFKEAYKNPDARRAGQKAVRDNPTLAKYALAYGGLVEGDPMARRALNQCGLTDEVLAHEETNAGKVVTYLEALFYEDPTLYKPMPNQPKWMPSKLELTLDSWTQVKSAALDTNKGKLASLEGTGAVDGAFARWFQAEAAVGKKKTPDDRVATELDACVKALTELAAVLPGLSAKGGDGAEMQMQEYATTMAGRAKALQADFSLQLFKLQEDEVVFNKLCTDMGELDIAMQGDGVKPMQPEEYKKLKGDYDKIANKAKAGFCRKRLVDLQGLGIPKPQGAQGGG